MIPCNTATIPVTPVTPAIRTAYAPAYAPAAQPLTIDGRRLDLEMYVEAPGEDDYDDEAAVIYDDGVLAIFYDGLEYTGLMTKSPASQDGEPTPHNLQQMQEARDALGLTLDSWAETDFGYTFHYSKH